MVFFGDILLYLRAHYCCSNCINEFFCERITMTTYQKQKSEHASEGVDKNRETQIDNFVQENPTIITYNSSESGQNIDYNNVTNPIPASTPDLYKLPSYSSGAIDTKELIVGSIQTANISTDKKVLLLKQRPRVHTFGDEVKIDSLTQQYESYVQVIRNRYGNPESELPHIKIIIIIVALCFISIIQPSTSDKHKYLVWLSWCACIIPCLLYILSWIALCNQDKIEKKYKRDYYILHNHKIPMDKTAIMLIATAMMCFAAPDVFAGCLCLVAIVLDFVINCIHGCYSNRENDYIFTLWMKKYWEIIGPKLPEKAKRKAKLRQFTDDVIFPYKERRIRSIVDYTKRVSFIDAVAMLETGKSNDIHHISHYCLKPWELYQIVMAPIYDFQQRLR